MPAVLGKSSTAIPGISIDLETVETNIVIFDIAGTGHSGSEICSRLKDNGVIASSFGKRIRMVTHCDVSARDVDTAVMTLESVLKQN